jgi:tetratricopeptide (TPR) repeat protein
VSEELQGASPEGVDPLATAMALAGADRAEANAFLRDQRHHMHEQLKEIGLRLWELRLGVMLRIATLIVGLSAAAGIGLMVWGAAQSNGLIIEPFNVPPDLAAQGLTGQVIASQMLDQLSGIDSRTRSVRPPRSFANNWGKDIKVEIPETGVSIGEFRRFLREWLGNDIHITGEVWRTGDGIAVNARAGGERGQAFSGPQSDLDAQVQKAAEHVYAQTQPYRYASYIRNQLRAAEARAAYLRLTESSSALERGWAWQGIATLPAPTGSSNRNAAWALRRALDEYPDYTLAYASIATAERGVGHDEAALAAGRAVERLLARNSIPDVDPAALPTARKSWGTAVPNSLGDFSAVVALARDGLRLPDQVNLRYFIRQNLSLALAHLHDRPAAQDALRQLAASNGDRSNPGRFAVTRFQVEAFLENWRAVLDGQAETERAIDATTRQGWAGTPFDESDILHVTIWPSVALAKAKTGDQAGAERLIAETPDDCYPCLRIRGLIAAQGRQWARADTWFAKAVDDAPSIPMAHEDWGRSLLERGKADDAIEQFERAIRLGPHFADALEGWGEALMAKNQSHLALAKFAEADKYAPNWGRLHLKWGEALAYSGQPEQAKAEFARAATLDLTPSEKSELTRDSHV